MKRTIIIAEAGVNHNGDLSVAKKLIKAAAVAGADYCKFQTFVPELNISKWAPKARYQINNTGEQESQLEMVRKLALSPEEHHELVQCCQNEGIGFLSTGFDLPSVDFLAELNLPFMKVPSGEITNLLLLKRIASFNKPVVLSTGMADLDEIEAALRIIFDNSNLTCDDVTILHCNTEYPTPFSDVNLLAMKTLAETFKTKVGYSDHTLGIEVPIAAVALGASVIEKHFTLDRNLPGPDQIASLEPDELNIMVTAIRNIEATLGDGQKRPSASEMKNRDIARKSIVASCAIKAGELLTEEKLAVKRPGNGISPMRWDEVVGSRAIKDFQSDELIVLS